MTSTLFRKLLIANRGEIACRIIRSACPRRGDGPPDAGDACTSPWRTKRTVSACHRQLPEDRSPARGRPPQRRIAIHPGYGFLAENAARRACEAAGWSRRTTAGGDRAMGLKSEARRLMAEAGVPLFPAHDPEQNLRRLRRRRRISAFRC
jgi:3-methylcrotonyl-CoA carboxylase alpha subunit